MLSDAEAMPGAAGRSVEASRVVSGGQEITLELTAAQISQVLSTMAEGRNRAKAVVLSGLEDARMVIEADRALLSNPHMSRGLLTGLVTLAAFPADGSYISSAEVARALGLHPSTAQRYLVTLEAVGLVERDPATRKVRLAG